VTGWRGLLTRLRLRAPRAPAAATAAGIQTPSFASSAVVPSVPSVPSVVAPSAVAAPLRAGRLRIVTYNIHGCRGLDRRCSPARIAEVLAEIDADVIALQEVHVIEDGRPDAHQARFIADALGMDVQLGANRTHRGGVYGNAVLSRHPFRGGRNYDLSVPGRERRGCMRADVALPGGGLLFVFNLHLGTAAWERRAQGRRLLEAGIVDNLQLAGPRVVLGDFNDWRAELGPGLLAARLNSLDVQAFLRRRRTYPGLLPVTHLDHMYFDDALQLEGVVLHRTRKAVLSSDHLPLAADFRLAPAPA
jgi:endonuclease/exonuclease/phosphatase family metal-dependent hydrolase